MTRDEVQYLALEGVLQDLGRLRKQDDTPGLDLAEEAVRHRQIQLYLQPGKVRCSNCSYFSSGAEMSGLGQCRYHVPPQRELAVPVESPIREVYSWTRVRASDFCGAYRQEEL